MTRKSKLRGYLSAVFMAGLSAVFMAGLSAFYQPLDGLPASGWFTSLWLGLDGRSCLPLVD